MKRTVYQFRCTQHQTTLIGDPVFVWDQSNMSWHVELRDMHCRMGAANTHEEECKKSWTVRTCDHIHLHDGLRRLDTRCNSMTCWNWRHPHTWTQPQQQSQPKGHTA